MTDRPTPRAIISRHTVGTLPYQRATIIEALTKHGYQIVHESDQDYIAHLNDTGALAEAEREWDDPIAERALALISAEEFAERIRELGRLTFLRPFPPPQPGTHESDLENTGYPCPVGAAHGFRDPNGDGHDWAYRRCQDWSQANRNQPT